ncbi:MAG: hypothetical protein R2710_27145 [Acidimicrobiales bacterium]
MTADSAGVWIDDLLPPSFSYVTGLATCATALNPWTPSSGTTITESSNLVTFNVGSGGAVTNAGETFHWTIAACAGAPPRRRCRHRCQPPEDDDSKYRQRGLPIPRSGVGRMDRAADSPHQGRLVHHRRDIDRNCRTLAANTDNRAVQAGDVVTYRVDLENTGNIDSASTEVWDVPYRHRLHDGELGQRRRVAPYRREPELYGHIRTSARRSIHRLWQPEDAHVRRCDLRTTVEPGHTFVNTAGVRSYQAATNASDSRCTTRDEQHRRHRHRQHRRSIGHVVGVYAATRATKVQQSALTPATPANGSLASTAEQVTIGEVITYSTTLTIPQGTTTYDGVFTSMPFPPDWRSTGTRASSGRT